MIARVIVCTLLAALYSGTALAQSKSGSSSSPSSSSTGGSSRPIEAPVGHRQPRATDVPSTEDRGDERPLTEAEKAGKARLERALKGVCRGC